VPIGANSIPAPPDLEAIITEGVKRGGRTNPSATQLTDAREHQFREVKSDLAKISPLIKTTAVTHTVIGQSQYEWPEDLDQLESVSILDAPDSYRGTAQAGSTTQITLAAALDVAEADMLGKFLLITGGVGVDQIRQCIGWNNSTKVWLPDTDWTDTTGVTSTYLVVTQQDRLYDESKKLDWNRRLTPASLQKPCRAAFVAEHLWLDAAPDKIYGLWWDYWAMLDGIGETSQAFIWLTMKWRSLFVQGVAVKTMQRYDDDRYPVEMQVYAAMLGKFEADACTIGQVQFQDV
jgi:hypothetical protein